MLPAFPLSPRLLAFPLWGLVAGWRGLWQWGAPLLEVQVGSRSPLPLPHQLRAVAEAPGVRGLWLKVDRLVLDGGQATLLDTVEAIRAVRAAGRLVVAEFEFVGNAELVLAAACDRAWLRPTTQVFCLGLGTTLRFYGDLLARFGASFDVEAVGEFKSFGETFSRGFASSANREAMSELLAGLSDEWIATLAELRPALGEAGVRDAIANAPLTASDAVKRGFFTATAYPDEVAAEVQTLVGTEPRTVSFAGWYKAWLRADRLERWMQGFGLVAVVWLRGAVMDGEGMAGAQAIAATPVVKALDALREDKSVRAVVLSVSSPGGSAPASDLIWRAVGRLASAKPVVARYGDISASGGVYLAASATEIVCHPASITGSIGVIAGKPVLRAALEKQGVHSEDLLLGPQADLFGETAFSEGSRRHLRTGLEETYRGFVERVAAGRKRPVSEIEPLARGRVWAGRRAHTLGLVDHLGGLGVAIARAGVLAGLGQTRTRDVVPVARGGLLQRLARRFMVAAFPELAALRVPDSARLLAASRGEALALLPFEIEVR
jgi:protease-4